MDAATAAWTLLDRGRVLRVRDMWFSLTPINGREAQEWRPRSPADSVRGQKLITIGIFIVLVGIDERAIVHEGSPPFVRSCRYAVGLIHAGCCRALVFTGACCAPSNVPGITMPVSL